MTPRFQSVDASRTRTGLVYLSRSAGRTVAGHAGDYQSITTRSSPPSCLPRDERTSSSLLPSTRPGTGSRSRPSVDLGRVADELAAELNRAREVGEGRPEDIHQIEGEAQKIEREIAAARAGDRDAADRADLALKELKAEVDRLDAETETSRLA